MEAFRAMSRTRVRPFIPAALILLVSAGPTAGAQSAPAKAVLAVDDVQMAWCLDFLVEPGVAGHLLPRGWTGTPAGSVAGLPLGLLRTFDEDAKYKAWIPARVCGISGRAANVSGVAVPNDKARKPPTAGWVQIASSRGQEGANFVVPILATNTFRIRNPLNALAVKIDDMSFENGPDPEHDILEDGLLAKMNGATIAWRGYLTPDSIPAPAADTLETVYQNDVDKSLRVRIIREGGTSNHIAGLVNVGGKGDLAAALKGSPIRLMSRVRTGGTASVSFYEAH
jgi:hypothetical protein